MGDFTSWSKRNIKILNASKFLGKIGAEVLIIGLGIFLGLKANNWNQNRLDQNHVNRIHSRILSEVDNDLHEMEKTLNRFNTMQPVFESVQYDSATPDLLDDNLATILQETVATVFNTSGVEQLKTLPIKDSLSLSIIEIYDRMKNVSVKPFEERISSEAIALNNYYRDTYSWYPEWVLITPRKDNTSKELQNYFLKNKEYRNFVISRYELVYEYYLPSLKQEIKKLKEVKRELEKKELL
ncbi:MAG: hypothetical protein R3218_04330 [Christiangramia sp.]|nr:hypothetical protein [Christiangramia sp.]